MARNNSSLFNAYLKNLERIYRAEILQVQKRAIEPEQFRASLVVPAIEEHDDLSAALDYHRHRSGGGKDQG